MLPHPILPILDRYTEHVDSADQYWLSHHPLRLLVVGLCRHVRLRDHQYMGILAKGLQEFAECCAADVGYDGAGLERRAS